MAPAKGLPSIVTGSRPTFEAPVRGAVVLATADDPSNPVQVTCEQAAPAVPRPPQPKWSTVDRPGRIGIPEFLGQDPYEILLTIRFDGFPHRSVESEIAILEGFAEVPPGRSEPPILTVKGAIPLPHPNLQWRIASIDDPTEQLYKPGGDQRCRYVTQVTLRQHVAADTLNESLRGGKQAKGIKTRLTRVRPGEQDLYAVARRYYGDPSRASDIARANFKGGNPLRLGGRLTAGQRLQMPS